MKYGVDLTDEQAFGILLVLVLRAQVTQLCNRESPDIKRFLYSHIGNVRQDQKS